MHPSTPDHPQTIVGTFYYGRGSFWLRTAGGNELKVTREEFTQEFQRLYPQRRLPWEGDRPMQATTD